MGGKQTLTADADPQVTEDRLLSLFAAPVAVAIATRAMRDAPLFPVESAQIARAVETRRAEFAAGRAAARLALSRLGMDAGPLPSRPDRTVEWPQGCIGSITHCDTLCCGVVGRRSDAASLGIDAEPLAPLPDGVADLVLTPADRRNLGGLPPILAFCAKEAFYKAYYPLAGKILEFRDVSVTFAPGKPGEGLFAARFETEALPLADRIGNFQGRWFVTHQSVVAGVIAPI